MQQRRFWGILPGIVSVGTMEQTGVSDPHKHYETEGCAFDSFNFHQDVPKQFFSCSNGKYGSSHILSKNGRHQEETNFTNEIWIILISKAITIRAEHLRGSLNVK